MSDQVHDWLLEVAIKSNVWNLPDLHRAVLAGTGDDVIVVRTPLNVEYSGPMTRHERRVSVYATNL